MMDKGAPLVNGSDAQQPRSTKEKYSEVKEKVAMADASTKPQSVSEGSSVQFSMTKSLQQKAVRTASEVGTNNTNGGGSGNNSDNSGLVSLGNNSFGFNFDSEEAMLNNSPSNSEADAKTGESDSDGNVACDRRISPKGETGSKSKQPDSAASTSTGDNSSTTPSLVSQETISKPHVGALRKNPASADLSIKKATTEGSSQRDGKKEPVSRQLSGSKRRAKPNGDSSDNDSGGYNSDDDEAAEPSLRPAHGGTTSSKVPDNTLSSSSVPETKSGSKSKESSAAPKNKAKKSKHLDDQKREERNAREKERSFRISRQINELRNLLSSGGVIVPKGTKSSVLTEAANYIRMLQQHQYRSEIDRHQLIQQMQMIGGGALGPQAATAVRHVAAQNGVWSLGNFGGVPPRSAMSFYQQESNGGNGSGESKETKQDSETLLVTNINEHEYRCVFNSCSVGMAIASMGGAFIDCNELFCTLSGYTKQEVCAMTIFNLTSRQDLQHAFDLISQMISPPSDGRTQDSPKACALRGSMKSRDDLGLSVSLIKGDDGIAKCFCVTLVKNPVSPFDSNRPAPATADLAQSEVDPAAQTQKPGTFNSTPAYTAG